MSHKHVIKKTRISFIEFDDVLFSKMDDLTYFGEGNSKGRKMEFDFEYCLECDLRMLSGKLVLTKGIFDDELEKLVTDAKNNCYLKCKEVTVQHSDYEILERLIKSVLSLSDLKRKYSK
ncbi:MAG: hypothetical protein LBH62_03660 [Nitrososphaerota archaeon]|uniref:hypothetical protein n=1 Tax=Candidatus Bathycorpusculum sp. TaxID=2994959 RepID=UPI00282116DE|nr:hypothetical protein [Candidatus Termiticorpusculum sp.]MCL2256889.1 hypothetical protein [Candidatus Termiticorpusculum sp.]MCL2292993.1 hypothetical protein [Candidatus Termiticorpusculum sp.]MDR0460522.1 hypothetical protein [Nitrososphaerota archaeon]